MVGFSLFSHQHPEAVIKRWLDLPEQQPFRITDNIFGQSTWVDKRTGDYPITCILAIEDKHGKTRTVHKNVLYSE